MKDELYLQGLRVSSDEFAKIAKKLTVKARKHIDEANFAIPEKAPGPGSYPIHDLAHARNALARVSAEGTPEEKRRVRAAVYAKYPQLLKRKIRRALGKA